MHPLVMVLRDWWTIVVRPQEVWRGWVHTWHASDPVLRWTLLITIMVGGIALTSASSVLGARRFGDSFFFIFRQVTFGLIPGIVVFLLLWTSPISRWKDLGNTAFIVSCILLLLPFIPGLGLTINNARSWIDFGIITIQPAEIVKWLMVIYLASWFPKVSKKIDTDKIISHFLVSLCIVSVLIILQPDIGTLAVIAGIAATIFFLAGAPVYQILFLGALGIGVLVVSAYIAPYRLARISVFLNHTQDVQGSGYHIAQAETAIANGGWWGQGLGESAQKFLRLPETATDSIFAVYAEETGFIGSLIGLLLLWTIIGRGWVLCLKTEDFHQRLLVGGMMSWISIQIFLNIMGILGLAPLTGLPLPFFSYGGSAYISLMAAMAIVLKISAENRKTYA